MWGTPHTPKKFSATLFKEDLSAPRSYHREPNQIVHPALPSTSASTVTSKSCTDNTSIIFEDPKIKRAATAKCRPPISAQTAATPSGWLPGPLGQPTIRTRPAPSHTPNPRPRRSHPAAPAPSPECAPHRTAPW